MHTKYTNIVDSGNACALSKLCKLLLVYPVVMNPQGASICNGRTTRANHRSVFLRSYPIHRFQYGAMHHGVTAVISMRRIIDRLMIYGQSLWSAYLVKYPPKLTNRMFNIMNLWSLFYNHKQIFDPPFDTVLFWEGGC